MPSFRAAEHLDVFEYFRCCHLTCSKDMLSDRFTFERLEKVFSHGIVITVSPTAHAGNDVVLFEKDFVVVCAVPATLVGIQDHFVGSFPESMHGRLQCRNRSRSPV